MTLKTIMIQLAFRAGQIFIFVYNT
ncbi:MAG: hypothetical protein ACD_7C00298G0001, partial [uncultured bacterium]